uniref:Transposase (putative) gypsy type domain-containing protein n=1 Tax=Fagus sylvatica TaxID=28930 RepID=A0A2N9HSQ7_FAGSY
MRQNGLFRCRRSCRRGSPMSPMEGMTREVSSGAVPSTSGSRPLPRVDRSWKAMSYFSKFNEDDVDRLRRRYQIPDDVVIRIPDSDERACCPKYEGDVAFYEADLRAGLRFPIQPFVRELLDFLSLAPGQVNPNGWRTIISCMVMWRVSSNGEEDLTVDEFLFCYEPVQIALSRALDRPLLNSVWQERISRILDIEDRRYNIFIEPDLLATFSLGPVPSSSVKALVRANKKRESSLQYMVRYLSYSSIAPLFFDLCASFVRSARSPTRDLRSGLRKRPHVLLYPSSTPPVIPTAVPSGQRAPPVILVDSDFTPPSASSTINQSPLVAMDRAKSAITSQDMDEYSVAHTEDLSLLMVHSLMRGLTEAMVMARRCASVEEDLAMLRAKSIADEAEMKNTKRAVMELTRDKEGSSG